MFLSTIAGVTGALALAAGSPVVAHLSPTASPVSVASCNYTTYDVPPLPSTAPMRHSNLRITFTNQSPLTATNVTFAVRYRVSTQIVKATGKFSSGTPISKDFTPSTAPEYHGPAKCSVQSVKFSDGTTWQAM